MIDWRKETTNTYDAEGLLLSTILELDWEADGIIDERHSTTNTYDETSLLLSSIYEYDGEADGIIDERELTTNTYDKTGLLFSTVEEYDGEADGTINFRELTTNTYDETGLLLSTVEERDWEADGTINFRESTTNTYDETSLLLSTVEESDWAADGIIDYRESTTNTYDETGLLLSTVYEDDGVPGYEYPDADGIIDYRNSTTNTYDETGSLLSTVEESDWDADGIIDSRAETLYEFNYAPTVSNPIPDVTATEDSFFDFQIPADTFTDVDVGDTLTYSATLADGSPLPNWLSFESENLTFSGTPTNEDVGNFSIAVMADDGNGGTVSDIFDLTIAADNDNDCIADELEAVAGERVAFYLVSNGTTNTLLGATVTPNVFFSINEANLDWEDLWADGDQDFNDLVLSVELATEPLSLQQLTASCQGFPEGEMLDLRGLAGQQVQAKLVVKREAAFDNFFGFYQVENEQGTIRDSLSGQLLNSEDLGYTQAVFCNSQEHGFSFEGRDASWQAPLNGGFLFTPFLIADGSPELILDDDPNNDRAVYFSYMGANPDRVDRVRLLGDNTFGFEDLFGGGDLDYNDVVFQVDCQIQQAAPSEARNSILRARWGSSWKYTLEKNQRNLL